MVQLGVNIDHVATVRQARKTVEPDPVWAAAHAELGGADGITIHLREDRRHIIDRDLEILRQTVQLKLNLEMAATDEMIEIACRTQPAQVTLVPERREEVTTEGGLDVAAQLAKITEGVARLKEAEIEVSLFLDPDSEQIEAAHQSGAQAIELHTGPYALARGTQVQAELARLANAGREITEAGMILHAGHGLTYQNVVPVAQLEGICELNIGHSIISRSIFVGLTEAVRQMKSLIQV